MHSRVILVTIIVAEGNSHSSYQTQDEYPLDFLRFFDSPGKISSA